LQTRLQRKNGGNITTRLTLPLFLVDSKSGFGIRDFLNSVNKVMRDKFEKDRAKGMKKRPVKVMVCGIPNSGKSTFINKLTGCSAARTGTGRGDKR